MDKNSIKDTSGKAVKAGVWYMLSTVIVKAINVITTPIYTRILSTNDYGIASNFSAWYSLLLVICTLDLEISIGRAKQDFSGKLDRYIGSMQLLSGGFTFFLLVIGVLFLGPVSTLLEMNDNLLLMLGVYLLFSPAIIYTQSKLRYQYQYKGNIAILFYTSISTVLLSLILIQLFDDDKFYGKVLGTIIPTILLGMYLWIKDLKKRNIVYDGKYWKYGLKLSLPMLIHTLSMNLLSQSDRVVITKICGGAANGIYTLAYQYAILINMIMQAISQAWLPWFHDNLYAQNIESIKKNVKTLTIFASVICIGCIALAPEAIGILGPESYAEGVGLVAPIAIGILCQFIYSNYINIELHVKKTKYASVGTIIAATFNIVTNLIFIPRYGYMAAAYTTCASYILLWIIHFLITKRILKISLYDDKFFVGVFLLVIGVAFLVTQLYGYILIRILLLLFILIAIIVLHKEIVIGFISGVFKKQK